jgi:hypothetical protein
VSQLSATVPTGDASPPPGSGRPRLRVRCVRHGWRAGLEHPPQARQVDFLLDGRVVRRDRSAPFRATLLARRARKHVGVHTVTARVKGQIRLQQRVHACRRTATNVSTRG